jgi:hypothetical protein
MPETKPHQYRVQFWDGWKGDYWKKYLTGEYRNASKKLTDPDGMVEFLQGLRMSIPSGFVVCPRSDSTDLFDEFENFSSYHKYTEVWNGAPIKGLYKLGSSWKQIRTMKHNDPNYNRRVCVVTWELVTFDEWSDRMTNGTKLEEFLEGVLGLLLVVIDQGLLAGTITDRMNMWIPVRAKTYNIPMTGQAGISVPSTGQASITEKSKMNWLWIKAGALALLWIAKKGRR